MKKYIDKYLEILGRNESNVFQRLLELAEQHVFRIEGMDEDLRYMSNQLKVKVVYDYFSQAIDKHNPRRGEQSLDPEMFGRMGTSIQSYDYMDNPKYKDLERVLLVIKETFGHKDIT